MDDAQGWVVLITATNHHILLLAVMVCIFTGVLSGQFDAGGGAHTTLLEGLMYRGGLIDHNRRGRW